MCWFQRILSCASNTAASPAGIHAEHSAHSHLLHASLTVVCTLILAVCNRLIVCACTLRPICRLLIACTAKLVIHILLISRIRPTVFALHTVPILFRTALLIVRVLLRHIVHTLLIAHAILLPDLLLTVALHPVFILLRTALLIVYLLLQTIWHTLLTAHTVPRTIIHVLLTIHPLLITHILRQFRAFCLIKIFR